MSSARMLVLGLWVLGVGVGLAGCDQRDPAGNSPPAAPAAGKVPGGASPAAKPAPSVTDAAKDVAKKVEKTAPALEEPLPPDIIQIKAEITRAKAQLDMTVAKLEVLVASTGDLDKPSEDAIAAIEALDAETKALQKRGDDMRERGAAYFEMWEKELAAMTTASVQKIAAASKDELSGKYSELLTAMQEARAAFDPLWTDMGAIRTSIEDGLTAETLKGLAPQVKKVKEAASLLKSRVDVVHARVDDVTTIYNHE